MNCRKIEFLIQSYVDGSATGQERESVDRHVGGCESCARVLRQSRQLVAALSTLPAHRVGEAFERNLAAAVQHTAPVSRSEAGWERFRLLFDWKLRSPALLAAGSLATALVAATLSPQVMDRATDRQRYLLSSAVERHQQLARASTDVDGDALDNSIALNNGSTVLD